MSVDKLFTEAGWKSEFVYCGVFSSSETFPFQPVEYIVGIPQKF